MAVDPATFEALLPEWADRWPDKGERVSYVRKAILSRPEEAGEAVVSLVWLGIEVMVDLVGDAPTICPALGDTFEILPDDEGLARRLLSAVCAIPMLAVAVLDGLSERLRDLNEPEEVED